MIEFIKSPGRQGKYELFIDGVKQESVSVTEFEPGGYISLDTGDMGAVQQLLAHKLDEFPRMRAMTIRATFDAAAMITYVELSPFRLPGDLFDGRGGRVHRLTLGSRPDLSKWNRAYDIAAYCEEMRRVVMASTVKTIFKTFSTSDEEEKFQTIDPGSTDSFELTFLSPASSAASRDKAPLDKVVGSRLAAVRKLHEEVEGRLLSGFYTNSVVTSFNFPEEVAVYCEQYLLYFVQFLKDLGMDATSELRHEAGQVLFTVTPTSQEEALDKIRTALDVYLRFPASPVSTDMTQDIAIQRLEATVLQLQSNLRLTAAELQAKNATIEAQSLTISTQRGLLSGEVILDSMKNVTPKPKDEDREEFIGGAVALTVFKGKGIEVNLANIFRQLRALFKKKGNG